MEYYCVFCEIIAGREPGTVRYQDDDVIIFDNILRWAPVMMMAMPKQHIAQQDLWKSGMLQKVSTAAVTLAEELCPNGFRLLSNFGPDALQTQHHAHIHILGGFHLGPYL